MPSSCAMNTSGDLAVGILSSSDAGDVVIFKNASGSRTVYTTSLTKSSSTATTTRAISSPTALTSNARVRPHRAPERRQSVSNDHDEQHRAFPWFRAVGRQVPYRPRSAGKRHLSVHGQRFEGDVEGHGNAQGCHRLRAELDRQGARLLRDAGNDDGEVFKYPAGGSPIAVFTGNFDTPLGVVAAAK